MRIGSVSDKEFESYQTEVKLLSALEHPNIVAHVESFVQRDRAILCIVMSYCEGGDLQHYLKSKGSQSLAEREILLLFVQLALALHFLHDRNILHRDLKMQNVFLQSGLIKLGDFGISKELTHSQDFAQTVIGTPYCSSQTDPTLLDSLTCGTQICLQSCSNLALTRSRAISGR